MKIAHVITRMIIGGAQENTLLTCQGLAERGHEVLLITGPSRGPEGALLSAAAAANIQVIEVPHLVRNPSLRHDGLAYQRLKRIFAQHRPEVVHTHSSKAGILGRHAAWARRVPLVVHTIHGLPFHAYQSRAAWHAWVFLERRAARRCHAIITVAEAMTRQALAAGVGRPEQYTTIYSGMCTETFLKPPTDRRAARHALGIPESALVFGTIARLQPLKGHDDILVNLPQLIAAVPNAHLLWIGDGVFQERLRQTAQRMGVAERITMTGLVKPEAIPALLPAMDILVHPSYREGLARAQPQAMLAGVPVISYDCDGAAEVCINGETGMLVRTGDSAALLAAMTAMAADAPLRQRLAARGRELCAERFSARRMVDAIEALYLRHGHV